MESRYELKTLFITIAMPIVTRLIRVVTYGKVLSFINLNVPSMRRSSDVTGKIKYIISLLAEEP